jgi:hypothetical protein
MVFPAVALLIACCNGVLLALKSASARHQPVVFTQMSPQVHGGSSALATAINIASTETTKIAVTKLFFKKETLLRFTKEKSFSRIALLFPLQRFLKGLR